MNYLSFRFYFKWFKTFVVISSILVNVFIIGFIIFNINQIDFTNTNTIIAILAAFLLVTFRSINDYYLIISKTVSFDNKYLYIWENEKVAKKIDITCVNKLVRKYYYFYLIVFNDKCSSDENIIFFISPNPPFTMPDNVKKLKSIFKNLESD